MKFCLLFLITFFLISCEKSIEKFEPYPGAANDTAWVSNNSTSLEINNLHRELMTAPLADSFDLQSGGSFQFGTTARVEIPNAAFTSSGSTATGSAKISLYVLKSKGDFMRFRKPTSSSSNLLQTANTFQVSVSKNGQMLTMLNSKAFRINLSDTFTSSAYRAFAGVEPAQSGFTPYSWARIDSISIQASTSSYQVTTNRQQWTSLSYGIDSATQKSRTVISMPTDFTNANTSAFVVFKNSQSVLQFVPDVADRIWIVDNVPVGKPVIYVTLTKKGNNYWLGTQEITTASNQNIRMVPVQKSLQEVNTFLNSL